MTGPRKRALNAVYLEFIFVVESDKAFFQLQNDTKIDLLDNVVAILILAIHNHTRLRD